MSNVPYEISTNERFLRAIKAPIHYKDTASRRLKASSLFMPACKQDGINIKVDGVSVDRLTYSTPLRSKGIIINNLKGDEKNTQAYSGFAVISLSDINALNTEPIAHLGIKSIKSEHDLNQLYCSSISDIENELIGFNTSPLLTDKYCGVIATPMLGKERIRPQSSVDSDNANHAHAEIFYVIKPIQPKPNEPLGLVITELARLLTEKSVIYFDEHPDDEKVAPDIQ